MTSVRGGRVRLSERPFRIVFGRVRSTPPPSGPRLRAPDARDTTHHRPPARLVPTNRALLEFDVKVAITGLAASPKARLQYRERAPASLRSAGTSRHIVHAGIDHRHQRVMRSRCQLQVGPLLCWLRLRRITSGLPSSATQLDELDPRRMHTEDVAEDQFAPLPECQLDDRLGVFDWSLLSAFP